jgi:hypothetical protein
LKTLATSRGLTRIAERTAAPAAEKALSPKPKSTSERPFSEEEEEEEPSLSIVSDIDETFPSKSTLFAAAALIHEGRFCLEPTIPQKQKQICFSMTFGIEGLRLLAFTVVGLRLLEGVIVMRRREIKKCE